MDLNIVEVSRCKENHFYSLPFGKLKLAFTSPDVISTSPKSFLMSRIDFTVLVIRIPQNTSLARRASKKQNSLAR